MKKPKMTVAVKKPKGSTAHHGQPKPRLRARHLSTIGKSAFGNVAPDAGAAAFPAAGAAFPPPPGGAPPMPGPMDAGAGALAGAGGGPPGM